MSNGWAIVVGFAGGIGVWCLVSSLPRFGFPHLRDRVAPYVLDCSEAARHYLVTRESAPLPIFGSLLAPAWAFARTGASRLLGGAAATERRLRQAGSPMTVEEFRSVQLLCALGALLLSVVSVVALAVCVSVPVVVGIVMPLMCAALGFQIRGGILARAAARRVGQIVGELPTLLEFMTLSLSAGENIHSTLERVSRSPRGELAKTINQAVTQSAVGVPLTESLRACQKELDIAPLTRVIEHLVGALERGTPLVSVLRAQAADARSEAKRRLLEKAGRKEVAMLMPLVFLILPLSILFAVLPGVIVIQTGF